MKHKWDWCSMCGAMVTCGKCGNNGCNGGSGRIGQLPNTMWGSTGVECDECVNAYKLQNNWKSCPLWLRIRHSIHMFVEFKIYIPLRNRLDHFGIDLDYLRGRSDKWPEVLLKELKENDEKKK